MSKDLNESILIVIPARGNSKGIPRKNIRSLNGAPLIAYSIQNALALDTDYDVDVFVSSDDAEILSIAKKLGAKTIDRNESLAQDSTTLDPVIFDGYQRARLATGKAYDLIITLQPTSPLLKTSSLRKALDRMVEDPEIDTLISACDDTHLTWRKTPDGFVPNYKARLNRQYLEKTYRETGGFLIARSRTIGPDTRIGTKVELFELKGEETIDIDTYEDWNLCEYYLRQKRVLFVLTGYKQVGLGHIYRGLQLANEILNHQVLFLVDRNSQMGFDKIRENNYPVAIQKSDDLLDDVVALEPDYVINDILDTSAEYVAGLKAHGYGVINFEDLGEGIGHADLVINAMYHEQGFPMANHYFGHRYYCLKTEFFLTANKVVKPEVSSVLLTFGGVDPNNYSLKVLEEIYDYCRDQNIVINVVAGLGYDRYDTLQPYTDVNFHRNVSNISDFMVAADIVFTSAGRTTFELASVGVPTIVMAQNEREMTHFFANQEFGFLHLGLGYEVKRGVIIDAFQQLVGDYDRRQHMHKLMMDQDIRSGKKRVIQLINDLIDNGKQ